MKALRPTNIPFPSTGSFTRASTATYVEDGLVKTAAINEPRWQDGQLLLEAEATNLLLRSEEFDAAQWSKTQATIGVNAGSAPNGIASADRLVEAATSGQHYVLQSRTTVAGATTFSVFVKAAERSWVRLQVDNPVASAFFDISEGTIGSLAGSVTPSIEHVGSGWFRCSISFTAVAATPAFYVFLSTGNGTTSYTGNGTSGLLLWGAQLEQTSTTTSYIPTTTATVTRAADTITGTGLIYSSATDARPLWSNATTYSIGQIIRYNNTVYESLQNTNLNKQPDTNPTWWLSLGADNISAAFDGKVGSKTTATDKLRMIIKPGTSIDSVGYIEATASTISTSAVDEDYNLVYSYKSGLDTSVIEDWYDYFFLDPLGDPLTQVVHQGINPLDPNLIVGVEMIRSGAVELGVFVTGQTTAIGKTQYGLRAGIVDYSKKEADEFGNITIVERPYSKRLEGDVYVNNYDLNKVQRFLYNVRATPILWIASDSEELAEVSNVYGFYKDFSTTIAYPDVSMCSLQIEGLV